MIGWSAMDAVAHIAIIITVILDILFITFCNFVVLGALITGDKEKESAKYWRHLFYVALKLFVVFVAINILVAISCIFHIG